jgi:hypothetical protein
MTQIIRFGGGGSRFNWVRAHSMVGVQWHYGAGDRVNALAGLMATGLPGRSRWLR